MDLQQAKRFIARTFVDMDLQSFLLEEDVNNYYSQLDAGSANGDSAENSQTNKWILEKHNMWTKITLNSFYEECAVGTVTRAQLKKWLYDVSALLTILKLALWVVLFSDTE